MKENDWIPLNPTYAYWIATWCQASSWMPQGMLSPGTQSFQVPVQKKESLAPLMVTSFLTICFLISLEFEGFLLFLFRKQNWRLKATIC